MSCRDQRVAWQEKHTQRTAWKRVKNWREEQHRYNYWDAPDSEVMSELERMLLYSAQYNWKRGILGFGLKWPNKGILRHFEIPGWRKSWRGSPDGTLVLFWAKSEIDDFRGLTGYFEIVALYEIDIFKAGEFRYDEMQLNTFHRYIFDIKNVLGAYEQFNEGYD